MGPLGLPEAEGCLYSFSQASGTIWSSSGVCATFLTHPPITLAVRKRSGSSQDLGDECEGGFGRKPCSCSP
eukprot:16448388-Heterocapsa_arctica.AAC.1